MAARLNRAPGLGLRARPWAWAVGLGLLGLLERLWLWRVYQPVPYGDTPSYLRLAGALSSLSLEGYDGTRAPGYPAFLALLGQEPVRVWLAQMVLGLAISLLLFWMTWRTTGILWHGAVLGLLYDAIPGQVLFEANLLTETLTAFLVVLSLALLVKLDRQASAGAGGLAALALGVAASLAGLARPLFFVLPVWLLPFVWSAGAGRPAVRLPKILRAAGWLLGRANLRRRLVRAVAFCLGPLLLLGGWILWVHDSYGMWSPTTMGGYHWVQHTGSFFEYLPDEVAPLRDTYLRYREAQIAERGTQTNAIWEAIPEMSEVSGLGFYDLSRELQRLSFQLIREHPDLYLRNVAEGWVAFWKAPVYWQPEALRVSWAAAPMSALAWAGRLLSVAANAVFLAMGGLAVLSARIRSRLGFDRFALAAGGLVGLISVVQTLVDHGDNPRFLMPLQMIVFYVVLRAVARLILTRRVGQQA